jgi:hypothetical protein
LLRKSTVRRFKKRLKKIWKKSDNMDGWDKINEAFKSWISYCRHSRCHRVLCNIYEEYWYKLCKNDKIFK